MLLWLRMHLKSLFYGRFFIDIFYFQDIFMMMFFRILTVKKIKKANRQGQANFPKKKKTQSQILYDSKLINQPISRRQTQNSVLHFQTHTNKKDGNSSKNLFSIDLKLQNAFNTNDNKYRNNKRKKDDRSSLLLHVTLHEIGFYFHL